MTDGSISSYRYTSSLADTYLTACANIYSNNYPHALYNVCKQLAESARDCAHTYKHVRTRGKEEEENENTQRSGSLQDLSTGLDLIFEWRAAATVAVVRSHTNICVSACLSVCLPVCLFICLDIYICICFTFVCLSSYLSVYLCTFMYI